ncbi:MAG: hypothetical protein A2163_07815 [Actinobacteria bacterium RBG_13_35_12]|nr:MAG: hypothetical protein A2163_07815 [Actinobacteria bacterium RBG_13_35_12]
MAAANTDKFKDLSRRWVGQIGAGGVADESTTTVPLASATNLSTDTAVVVVIDRVDANGTATPTLEETIIGVVSGSNLVSCVRGAEGTAQAHAAGAVVEVLVTAKGWNDLIDGLLVQHNQLGLHTNISASNINASGTISNQITNADLVLAGNGTGKVKENARYGVLSSDTIASSQVILNMATANNHAVVLTSVSTTSIIVSNVTVNQVFTVRLLQDAGGTNLVSWFSTIKWTSATVPTLTTTAARADWFGFICTSASNYDGFTIGSGLG